MNMQQKCRRTKYVIRHHILIIISHDSLLFPPTLPDIALDEDTANTSLYLFSILFVYTESDTVEISYRPRY